MPASGVAARFPSVPVDLPAGEFVVRVAVPITPAHAWSRVWDLDRQTEVIPLTVVSLQPPASEPAAGAAFCGRTALGPLGFDDPMTIQVWEPPPTAPGRVLVEKTGRAVGGRIEMTFDAVAGGTVVTWRQRVELPWLPAPMAALEQVLARLVAPGYRAVLRRLLAEPS